jgi:NADPH:quinone reductase-like Zn-dependent oxidoreductase
MNAVTDTIRTTRSPTAVAGGRTMKGMIQDVYAPPEGLSLREIAMPAVGPDDVLVRVHAAALNVSDCFGVRGAPLPMRLGTGLFRPKPGVPGHDMAGQVDSVGSRVTKFRIGMRCSARVRELAPSTHRFRKSGWL